MRAGRDWQAGRVRYLVHFSDGGSGMRHFDEPLASGRRAERGRALRGRAGRAAAEPGRARARVGAGIE